jgi:hypothetical protein
MEQNLEGVGVVEVGLHWSVIQRAPMLRHLALMIVASLSAGCADDVVMRNPQTGMTETCRESMSGFNPWSQKMACVAGHEAQGWTLVSGE